MKKVSFFALMAMLFSAAFAALLLVFSGGSSSSVLPDEPNGIDCMPPMSASEQACLDSGRCYCETY